MILVLGITYRLDNEYVICPWGDSLRESVCDGEIVL